jgi:hypothetical protein
MGAKENKVDYSLERANFGEGLGGIRVKEIEKRRKVECVCVCMCGCVHVCIRVIVVVSLIL